MALVRTMLALFLQSVFLGSHGYDDEHSTLLQASIKDIVGNAEILNGSAHMVQASTGVVKVKTGYCGGTRVGLGADKTHGINAGSLDDCAKFVLSDGRCHTGGYFDAHPGGGNKYQCKCPTGNCQVDNPPTSGAWTIYKAEAMQADSGTDITVIDGYQVFRVPATLSNNIDNAVTACANARSGAKPLGNYPNSANSCGNRVQVVNHNGELHSKIGSNTVAAGNYGSNNANCGYSGRRFIGQCPSLAWCSISAQNGVDIACAMRAASTPSAPASSPAPAGSGKDDDACEWANDGVCDEPDSCKAGTDVDDCKIGEWTTKQNLIPGFSPCDKGQTFHKGMKVDTSGFGSAKPAPIPALQGMTFTNKNNIMFWDCDYDGCERRKGCHGGFFSSCKGYTQSNLKVFAITASPGLVGDGRNEKQTGSSWIGGSAWQTSKTVRVNAGAPTLRHFHVPNWLDEEDGVAQIKLVPDPNYNTCLYDKNAPLVCPKPGSQSWGARRRGC